MYSRFDNNQALNGGAVYHQGPAVIRGTDFIGNRATVRDSGNVS